MQVRRYVGMQVCNVGMQVCNVGMQVGMYVCKYVCM